MTTPGGLNKLWIRILEEQWEGMPERTGVSRAECIHRLLSLLQHALSEEPQDDDIRSEG